MASRKYVNIYIGNHGLQDGVEDYITLFNDIFTKRDIDVVVSRKYDASAINIIFDEFTNYVENERLALFKADNPESKIVIALTEFVRKKLFVESFNNFGGMFEDAIIVATGLFVSILRKDIGVLQCGTILRALLYSPLLFFNMSFWAVAFLLGRILRRKTLRPLARLIKSNHRTMYFHMRYLGLKANLKYADAVIASHEEIYRGLSGKMKSCCSSTKYLGVVYAEFDEDQVIKDLMLNKELFIELTGSMTKYRQKYIEKINRLLVLMGISNVFTSCRAFFFSDVGTRKNVKRGAYSLHPPQTRTWPYCSPTRIYRALAVDHNIPILTKYFGQNPIEDVCLRLQGVASIADFYKLYFDRESLLAFIRPKITTYNQIARQNNDDLVRDILLILDEKSKESNSRTI